MSWSRRQFLRNASALFGATALGEGALQPARAYAASDMAMRGKATTLAAPKVPLVNPSTLTKFVDPLPIPLKLHATGERTHPAYHGRALPYYRIAMQPCETRVHRDLPKTAMWGYAGSVPGPTLEVQRDQPILVEWVNALPSRHFLPIDHTLHGAERDKPDVRTVTHVHGARVNADSDGWPEDWFVPGKSALYHYANHQDAATLWYHDHAMGITRLNIYAGLFGAFLVRDPDELELDLPSGEYDLPLLLCDRLIARDGQLYYPVSDDPGAPWVMQCQGNLVLCNGKAFPYLEVEARRYRLRLFNVANSSFFDLSLSHDAPFHQIGSDQGLLSGPVERARIELYPAERADVVVDFTSLGEQQVQLRHQNQGILEFRVRDRKTPDGSRLPTRLRPVPRIAPTDAVQERVLALIEQDDSSGNALVMLLDGKRWSDPISEKPVQGSVEIWSFVNNTADAHPIHLHLVRFQILERRPFDLFAWNAHRELRYTGTAQPLPPHEAGWKDTVRADPGLVTRIALRFEGEPGRYVWHCHLLEHEDNEMMRPFELRPANPGTR